jgi:hypothetical protein
MNAGFIHFVTKNAETKFKFSGPMTLAHQLVSSTDQNSGSFWHSPT